MVCIPVIWVTVLRLRLDASTAAAMTNHVPKNIDINGVNRFDVIFFPSFSEVDTSLAADDERLKKKKEHKDAGDDPIPPEINDPAIDSSDPPDFSSSLTVAVLEGIPSKVSEEMVKAYADRLVAEMKSASDFSGVKVLDSRTGSVSSMKSFEFVVEFSNGRRTFEVNQTLVIHYDETLIITCINDDNETEDDREWCKNAVNSLKIK